MRYALPIIFVIALVSLLYAHLVSHDTSYTLVCLGNVAGCYAVTGVALLRRQRHAAAAALA